MENSSFKFSRTNSRFSDKYTSTNNNNNLSNAINEIKMQVRPSTTNCGLNYSNISNIENDNLCLNNANESLEDKCNLNKNNPGKEKLLYNGNISLSVHSIVANEMKDEKKQNFCRKLSDSVDQNVNTNFSLVPMNLNNKPKPVNLLSSPSSDTNKTCLSNNSLSSHRIATQPLKRKLQTNPNFSQKRRTFSESLALKKLQLADRAEQLRIAEENVQKKEEEADAIEWQAIQEQEASFLERERILETRKKAAERKYDEAMKSIEKSRHEMLELNKSKTDTPNLDNSFITDDSLNQIKYTTIIDENNESLEYDHSSENQNTFHIQRQNHPEKFVRSDGPYKKFITDILSKPTGKTSVRKPGKKIAVDMYNVEPKHELSSLKHTYSRKGPKKRYEEKKSYQFGSHFNQFHNLKFSQPNVDLPGSSSTMNEHTLISDSGTITITQLSKYDPHLSSFPSLNSLCSKDKSEIQYCSSPSLTHMENCLSRININNSPCFSSCDTSMSITEVEKFTSVGKKQEGYASVTEHDTKSKKDFSQNLSLVQSNEKMKLLIDQIKYSKNYDNNKDPKKIFNQMAPYCHTINTDNSIPGTNDSLQVTSLLSNDKHISTDVQSGEWISFEKNEEPKSYDEFNTVHETFPSTAFRNEDELIELSSEANVTCVESISSVNNNEIQNLSFVENISVSHVVEGAVQTFSLDLAIEKDFNHASISDNTCAKNIEREDNRISKQVISHSYFDSPCVNANQEFFLPRNLYTSQSQELPSVISYSSNYKNEICSNKLICAGSHLEGNGKHVHMNSIKLQSNSEEFAEKQSSSDYSLVKTPIKKYDPSLKDLTLLDYSTNKSDILRNSDLEFNIGLNSSALFPTDGQNSFNLLSSEIIENCEGDSNEKNFSSESFQETNFQSRSIEATKLKDICMDDVTKENASYCNNVDKVVPRDERILKMKRGHNSDADAETDKSDDRNDKIKSDFQNSDNVSSLKIRTLLDCNDNFKNSDLVFNTDSLNSSALFPTDGQKSFNLLSSEIIESCEGDSNETNFSSESFQETNFQSSIEAAKLKDTCMDDVTKENGLYCCNNVEKVVPLDERILKMKRGQNLDGDVETVKSDYQNSDDDPSLLDCSTNKNANFKNSDVEFNTDSLNSSALFPTDGQNFFNLLSSEIIENCEGDSNEKNFSSESFQETNFQSRSIEATKLKDICMDDVTKENASYCNNVDKVVPRDERILKMKRGHNSDADAETDKSDDRNDKIKSDFQNSDNVSSLKIRTLLDCNDNFKNSDLVFNTDSLNSSALFPTDGQKSFNLLSSEIIESCEGDSNETNFSSESFQETNFQSSIEAAKLKDTCMDDVTKENGLYCCNNVEKVVPLDERILKMKRGQNLDGDVETVKSDYQNSDDDPSLLDCSTNKNANFKNSDVEFNTDSLNSSALFPTDGQKSFNLLSSEIIENCEGDSNEKNFSSESFQETNFQSRSIEATNLKDTCMDDVTKENASYCCNNVEKVVSQDERILKLKRGQNSDADAETDKSDDRNDKIKSDFQNSDNVSSLKNRTLLDCNDNFRNSDLEFNTDSLNSSALFPTDGQKSFNLLSSEIIENCEGDSNETNFSSESFQKTNFQSRSIEATNLKDACSDDVTKENCSFFCNVDKVMPGTERILKMKRGQNSDADVETVKSDYQNNDDDPSLKDRALLDCSTNKNANFKNYDLEFNTDSLNSSALFPTDGQKSFNLLSSEFIENCEGDSNETNFFSESFQETNFKSRSIEATYLKDTCMDDVTKENASYCNNVDKVMPRNERILKIKRGQNSDAEAETDKSDDRNDKIKPDYQNCDDDSSLKDGSLLDCSTNKSDDFRNSDLEFNSKYLHSSVLFPTDGQKSFNLLSSEFIETCEGDYNKTNFSSESVQVANFQSRNIEDTLKDISMDNVTKENSSNFCNDVDKVMPRGARIRKMKNWQNSDAVKSDYQNIFVDNNSDSLKESNLKPKKKQGQKKGLKEMKMEKCSENKENRPHWKQCKWIANIIPSAIRNNNSLECGKCTKVFSSVQTFKSHAYRLHNGLVRLKGESQEFDEPLRNKILSIVFKVKKKLLCTECNKFFKSFGGFKNHSEMCGKTKADLYSFCNICNKKLLSTRIEAHERNHGKKIRLKAEKISLGTKRKISLSNVDDLKKSVGMTPRKVAKYCHNQIKKITKHFRKINYSDCLYTTLLCQSIDWIEVNDDDLHLYQSGLPHSPLFSLVKNLSDKDISWEKIQNLKGNVLDSSEILFAGGPIRSLAWCPTPVINNNKPSQYIAVSCINNPDQSYPLYKSKKHSGLLQIWHCGNLTKSEIPELSLGIAHDNGVIWSMEWCPSGIYENPSKTSLDNSVINRLGLLAAAFSDGIIRVYLIPHPHQIASKNKIFKKNPEFFLCPYNYENLDLQCVKVSWCSSKNHSLIAGSFTNGMVCIWNLNCTSTLLSFQDSGGGTKLYPINSISAHIGVCSAVSFFPKTEGRHIVTGGYDRTIKYWDLIQPEHPINIIKNGVVTDSVWLPHWAGAFFSFDDTQNVGGKPLITFCENGFYGSIIQSELRKGTTVWSISGSDWLNAIVQADEAGDVILSLQGNLNCKIQNKKRKSKTRFPCFSAKIERLKKDKPLCKESSQLGIVKTSFEKNVFQTKEHQRIDRNTDLSSPELFIEQPLTYAATMEDYGIKFYDEDYQNPSKLDKISIDSKQCSELTESESLTRYPLMGCTSVSWNNNYGTHTWICVGFHSGLVRLVRIPYLE